MRLLLALALLAAAAGPAAAQRTPCTTEGQRTTVKGKPYACVRKDGRKVLVPVAPSAAAKALRGTTCPAAGQRTTVDGIPFRCTRQKGGALTWTSKFFDDMMDGTQI